MAQVTPDGSSNSSMKIPKTVLDRASTTFGKTFLRRRSTLTSSIYREKKIPGEENPTIPKGVIHPESAFATYWSLCTSVCIFYSMLMVPMRIAFGLGVDVTSYVLWFEVFVDFLFWVDIYIQFRLGYKSSDDEYVLETSKIRLHYLKTWFAIDLISAIPFDLVLLASSKWENFIFTKLFKTFRLIRVAKLIKISKLRGILDSMEATSWYFPTNPGVRRLLETGVLVFLLSHWTCCTWFFVSANAVESGEVEAWVLDESISESYWKDDTWSLYVASMYWAVSTLTSVGFGDFRPQSNIERIVATLSCWLGATVFGYVIGQMSSIVADLNQASFHFHRKMDSINSYLKYRKVPAQLQRRIRRFYRYYIRRKMIFDENQILKDLTQSLKLELSMYLTKDVIKEIHIFKNIEDPSFIAQMVTMLKPFSAAPGDYIIREGEFANEMFLIVRGTVEVVSSDGVQYTQLSAGHHFGEISQFNMDGVEERRASSVRALTYCDLFSFSKGDFAEVAHNFPEVYEQIMNSTGRRMAVAKNLKTHQKVRKVTTGTKENPYFTMPENPTGTNVSVGVGQKFHSTSAAMKAGTASSSFASMLEVEDFEMRPRALSSAKQNERNDPIYSARSDTTGWSPTLQARENALARPSSMGSIGSSSPLSPASPQLLHSRGEVVDVENTTLMLDILQLQKTLSDQSAEIQNLLGILKKNAAEIETTASEEAGRQPTTQEVSPQTEKFGV